jgi:hypothetical protein
MINRFRLYQQNVGTFSTITWIVVLGYLVWNQFQWNANSTKVVMLTVFGLCLIAPLAVMPICERYPRQSARLMSYLQYVLLGFILISFFNVYQFPGMVYLLFVPMVFFFFGWSFWFFSSPQIFTDRRVVAIHDRMMAEEERALEHEIKVHQGLYGDSDADQDPANQG